MPAGSPRQNHWSHFIEWNFYAVPRVPNASEERFFCRKRNRCIHITAYLMYIWHHNDGCGTPKELYVSIIYGAPTKCSCTRSKGGILFLNKKSSDWLKFRDTSTCLNCTISTSRDKDTVSQRVVLNGFFFQCRRVFLCWSTTCQRHQTWAQKNISLKLICVFFESFVKFIDLNYGAFLYSFNITIMLFSPHV